MLKIDYSAFWKHTGVKRMKKGCYNIWLFDPDEDFGFKIYTTFVNGPASLSDPNVVDIPLLSEKDEEYMFLLQQNLYEKGYFPQPIERIKYKSVRCIKMQRADSVYENDRIYIKREHHIDFTTPKRLRSIFAGRKVNTFLYEDPVNYGRIDNKLVLIDLDFSDLDWTLERIREKDELRED